jgi:hypothetical protein
MYLLLFSGFHGTHRSPAQLSHGIEDNTQEAHDVADFDISDKQAVLEKVMSNMSAGYDVNSCWKTQAGGGNFSISCQLGVSYTTLRGSAGHDEQGRFASEQVGEVPLQWICL